MNEVDDLAILDDAPIQDNYDPPDEDRELAERINDRFMRAHEARMSYEREWDLYRRYLKGDQLIVRHRETGALTRLVEEDAKRLRSVHNVCRPTSRSLVGKLTRTIPTCVVVPATTDFDEQEGARVGDAFFRWIRHNQHLDEKYLDVCEFLPWAGNGFLEVKWDEQAGSDVAYCEVCNFYDPDTEMVEQPCPRCTMQQEQEAALASRAVQMGMPQQEIPQMGPLEPGQPVPMLVEASEGSIGVEVHDVRNIYPEPGAKDLGVAQWVIIREPVPVQLARMRYPAFSNILHAEDNVFHDMTVDTRFDQYGGSVYVDNYCYEFTVYEKPTGMYPNGRIIKKVNDYIVSEKPGNYSWFKRFPLFRFGFDKNCGEFWYEPPMAQAWHMQKENNQLQSQKREHVELLCKQKLLNPIGSRISEDEFTSQTAQSIKYNAAAGEPHFIPPPPMPSEVWSRDAELVQNIRAQFGITAQEAGVSPQQPNGRAMAIVEAEADQQIRPILVRNNSEWRHMHKCILIMAQKQMRPERKFTIAGPDGSQTYSFDQLNLTGDWDVQIEEEDGLSRNPAVRQTQTNDLAQIGFYTDPKTGVFDKKAYARDAKLKKPQSGYDYEASEQAAASQIPYKLREGMTHQPQPWDIPSIFAEVLTGWLRGPGRREEDQQLLTSVVEIWKFYTDWAMSAAQGGPPPQMQAFGGGGSQAGSDQSAPGGTPNNPGRLGTDLRAGADMTDLRSQANAQVQGANRAAEAQARVQSMHEG